MHVAIIDYGSGNLKSASKAFERASRESGVNAKVELTSDAERVRLADRIVLPGVGAFADCRAGLDAVPGMVEVLDERVRDGGAPFLGICVGMQLMATRGMEKQITSGLNWIAGDVVEMKPQDASLKIPQIGWNTLETSHAHPLLNDLELGDNGFHAYFVHSYHMQVEQLVDCVATTHYGMPVTAMVAKDNMAGTQFHPEKSQTLGLALISNFLKWRP